MQENKMSDMIRASLDGIKDFSDTDTVVGNVIRTDSGMTVIPISKITLGLATGGIDYAGRRASQSLNFGGGGGTAASITPIGFLIISKREEVRLIKIDEKEDGLLRIADLFEKAPEIIERIKNSISE